MPSMRFMLLACCLSLATGELRAQTPAQTQQKPYEPSVGQPGKDVVWVPTSDSLVEKMLEMANVTAADYVIDLGSGDGRTVITAAKRGIEYNPEMVELSKRNAAGAGPAIAARASFAKADIFESDFSQATVITMFLLPELNLRLRPKLLELKPGTRIVSNSFTMDDWQPDERATITGDCSSWCTALFWVVPAMVDGAWQTPQGALVLKQQFQMLSGTFGAAPLSNGRLRGDAIEFDAGGTHYTGRVVGNVMQGTSTGGSTGAWRATRQ
jgi:hypothetical protein